MERENAGATTIIVVCIMAVIMALSMGLFLTASVLTRNAGRTLSGEQCKILAVSFSNEVSQMLTGREYTYDSMDEEEAARAEKLSETSIWYYVKQNISDGSWPYYDEAEGGIHSRENSVRSFQMNSQGTVSEIADITLTLYWLKGEAENRPGKLIVETTAVVKEQACTVQDIYELEAAGSGDYDRWSWKHVEKK